MSASRCDVRAAALCEASSEPTVDGNANTRDIHQTSSESGPPGKH